MPRYTRYAAPANFTALNATAEERMIAESPTTAAATCTSVPTWTPPTDTSPATRPCCALCATM